MKRRLLLTAFMALACLAIMAQNTQFGVCAGTSIASQKGKSEGYSYTGDSKVGITIGVLAKVLLASTFYFQPGLNFTQKGYKYSESGYTEKVTLNYLELLLNFIYAAQAGNGKFFAGAGPGVGMGMSGKWKYSGGGNSEDGDIKFGSDENEDDYKPLEISGNILAGYEFAMGLFIMLNYNLGLNNICPGGNSDNSSKNRYFGIRLGYLLSGKKK